MLLRIFASVDQNDELVEQQLTAKNLTLTDAGLQSGAFAMYLAALSWWIRCVCGNPGCWGWLWAITRGRLTGAAGWLQLMTKWPQTTVGWSKPLFHSWRRRSTLRPLPYLSGLLIWWIIRVPPPHTAQTAGCDKSANWFIQHLTNWFSLIKD